MLPSGERTSRNQGPLGAKRTHIPVDERMISHFYGRLWLQEKQTRRQEALGNRTGGSDALTSSIRNQTVGEEPRKEEKSLRLPLTRKEVPGSQSSLKGINRIRQENMRPHKFKIECS